MQELSAFTHPAPSFLLCFRPHRGQRGTGSGAKGRNGLVQVGGNSGIQSGSLQQRERLPPPGGAEFHLRPCSSDGLQGKLLAREERSQAGIRVATGRGSERVDL